MISVVMPIFNEMQNGYIQRSLPLLKSLSCELILVDGGSTDGTTEFLDTLELKYISAPKSTRLKRLQIGLSTAQGEIIILHHPRSILEARALKEVLYTPAAWGAFTHKFDYQHPLLKFTSFYSNFIRGDLKHIFYLDHCLYLKSDLKERLLSIKDCEIFEDTEICKELIKYAKPLRLKAISYTSAVRFLKNGVIKQAILNQKMKWLYYKNSNHKIMNKEYEKDLNLNNETK